MTSFPPSRAPRPPSRTPGRPADRPGRGPVLIAGALLLLAGLGLLGLATVSRPAERTRPSPGPTGGRAWEIHCLALGRVRPSVMAAAARAAREATGFRVLLSPEGPALEPDDRLAPDRLDGGRILERLSDRLPLDAVRVLAVTELHLAYGRDPSAFGLGQPEGKVAVVSVRRLLDQLDRETAVLGRARARARLEARIRKVVIHELGHTFREMGEGHCREPACVMAPVFGLDDLDRLSPRFCEACRAGLDATLAGDFNNHVTYYNLGCYFEGRGLADRAEEAYRRSTERKPSFAPAWNNLGAVLGRRGRWGDAVRAFRRALAGQPGYETAALNLGAALVRLDRLAEARGVYEGLYERGNGRAALHLGRLWRDRLGEAETARRWFRRFLEGGGRDEDAEAWMGKK